MTTQTSDPTQQRSVTHSTFVLERSYSATPDRVFAAFAEPVKKQRWFAGSDSRDYEVHEMDFREGRRERTCSRMKENTPFPGVLLTNDTVYLEIIQNRRIVFAYTMTLGEKRFSASLATVEVLATGTGTELIFTDQGAYFEGADGPQMREHGWNKLLDRVAGVLEQ